MFFTDDGRETPKYSAFISGSQPLTKLSTRIIYPMKLQRVVLDQ